MADYNNILKQHFPMIRDRLEILNEIRQKWSLWQTFQRWAPEQQNEFLDICTGVKGLKITYDPFFKEIMNPEYDSERLNDFLSELMHQKVKVLLILPNDTVRITIETTLLITDIVIQLEDGSIVNLEMQKIGYKFPGERAACYSADLLLRQYKRVRGNSKKANYKDIKPVYTIILFEKSPAEFHEFSDIYIHEVKPKSNTGIKLNLLQSYWFIPLDIFHKTMHNKPIRNRLDAWLQFFSSDRPEDVIQLITVYPEFKPMYEDIYKLCLNTERVMDMFSQELYELDTNTVKYMMDEMQEEIDGLQDQVAELQEKSDGLQDEVIELKEKNGTLQEKNNSLQAEIIDLQKQLVKYEK